MLAITDLGRVASHYYLRHETVEMYNTELDTSRENGMDEAMALGIVSRSQEFAQVCLLVMCVEVYQQVYCYTAAMCVVIPELSSGGYAG